MTIRVDGCDGRSWAIRRGVVRGRDGRGWRWRWRGPDPDWLKVLQVGHLAELPLVGAVFFGIFVFALVTLAAIFLPFVTLAVFEVVALGLLFGAGALAATLFGRPILIRAEADDGELLAWAVRGWGQSRAARDRIAEALRAGIDPRPVAGAEARFIDETSPTHGEQRAG